ncbi:Por secretion system C-terminal sorting domain-containing protein [Flavobacterium swingsii]|jgi:endonuclease I|uniref:Por secretion system C-terminal sorting domain-containing protein n=1 Tax=Flavobacterium swingsii TaxID=498292 RepID=A0A1I0ZMN5_9FLAO|nr:endonuclease [Flavobacterium swingsii]SFB26346.1 Por secretion system C-terminal sorting domain-containing protein [Flavobacterium swingsii]
MKKIYSLIAILIASIGFAQIPAGYYSTATGTGYTLKTQLYNIINGHTDLGYGGLWTTYQTSDRDVFTGTGYENDNTIYDIYTENPTGSIGECNYIYATDQDTGSGGGSECEFYNREHIIPQSIFSQASPMRNDAHFIPPADKRVNAVRADFPHGTVATTSWTSNNGGKLGTSAISGYVGNIFEPNSAFKGDIARMYFYFATRYENTVSGYSYEMFNNTSNQVFTPAFLNMLITWHTNDPVSQFETTRNNAIYARQNNRNPYIDHPEYVCLIWNAACALSTNSFELIADINVYPNPTNDQTVNIETENELDEIQLISVNGQIMQQISNPVRNQNKYTLENLPHGFYFLKLSSDNKSIVKKIVIN